MSINRFFTLAFASLTLAACTSEDSSSTEIIRPTNLQVAINVSATVEGRVDVSTNATFANFYRVSFVDTDETVTLETKDGETSYTFSESGTYAIISRAYASFEYFIEKTDSVTVTVTSNTGSNEEFPTTGYTTPLTYAGYTLAWNDEFDGTSLSSDWVHEIGNGNNGWGNQEKQYYRSENTEVREGYLVITAKEEAFGGRNYTSSRIITKGQQDFEFGRIDIRAAMPQGQGLWPALWMLGSNFNTVGWPECGEIDIMEMVGGSGPNRGDSYNFGTAHWDNNGSKADFGSSIRKTTGRLADDFHVYSIVWDSTSLVWFFDDVQFHQMDISPAALDEFREKFFFIFNIAVGGIWPGSPDASTVFPQKMAVDYVRVFQK
jgi:hypothetical protein